MYEDLLGPRPDKPKEPKNKINVKEEEIDLEMDTKDQEGSPTPEEEDPWKGVAEDLDLEDLEDMDDCDGDCDNCDLDCAEDEKPISNGDPQGC